VSWATNADYQAVFQRAGESYDLASCTDELYYLMPQVESTATTLKRYNRHDVARQACRFRARRSRRRWVASHYGPPPAAWAVSRVPV